MDQLKALHGTLRLRAPAAFAVHQLAKHLPGFHALHPQLSVEVCTSSDVDDIDDDDDLAIVWRQRPLDGDFVACRLARTEVILCASPDYLDRRGRPSDPAELGEHMLLLRPATRGRERVLTLKRSSHGVGARDHERLRITPRAIAPVSTTNGELRYAGALAGLGICALPSFVAEDAVLESALERVLPQWHLHEWPIWARTPMRKRVPVRTRAMLEFLVATFGGEDRDPWLAFAGAESRRLVAVPSRSQVA